MITDGAQTTNGVKGPYIPLDKASQPLKDKGVDVWSIGVGKGAKKSDLVTIASDPGKVIMISSFKNLKDILGDVQKAACEGMQPTSLRLLAVFFFNVHMKYRPLFQVLLLSYIFINACFCNCGELVINLIVHCFEKKPLNYSTVGFFLTPFCKYR